MKKISINVDDAEFSNLSSESDKGCVLLVAAMFDRLLGELHAFSITTNLGENPGTQKFIKDRLMNDNCPLYDFANKVKLAYAFKMITEGQYQALYAIRDLRNEAAHCVFHFTFKNEGVTNHLNKLDVYKKRALKWLPPRGRTTKLLFIESCEILFYDLLCVGEELVRQRAAKDQ